MNERSAILYNFKSLLWTEDHGIVNVYPNRNAGPNNESEAFPALTTPNANADTLTPSPEDLFLAPQERGDLLMPCDEEHAFPI